MRTELHSRLRRGITDALTVAVLWCLVLVTQATCAEPPTSTECYEFLIDEFTNGIRSDQDIDEAQALIQFFSTDKVKEDRVGSAIHLARTIDVEKIPFLRLSQLAISKTADEQIRCWAVLLISRGMIDAKWQSTAERALFEIERDIKADMPVRAMALTSLWSLTTSPNALVRDAKDFFAATSLEADDVRGLGMKLYVSSLLMKRVSFDATANCFIAAYRREMPLKQRDPLFDLILDVEKHDRTSGGLEKQTLFDIHRMGEYEFCLESNTELFRTVAIHLIDPSLASKDTKAVAASISTSKDASTDFRNRTEVLLKRITDGTPRWTFRESTN